MISSTISSGSVERDSIVAFESTCQSSCHIRCQREEEEIAMRNDSDAGAFAFALDVPVPFMIIFSSPLFSLLCVFMIVFVVVPEWCASRTAMTAAGRPRARSPEIA